MDEIHGTTHGVSPRPTATCHPKHMHPTRSETGLSPPPCQKDCSQERLRAPTASQRLPVLWEKPRGPVFRVEPEVELRAVQGEATQIDGEYMPWAGEALHVPRHTALVPPLLPRSLPRGPQPAKSAAAGLGGTLYQGNWDPHHTPELPNAAAEEQRCRSCPKGLRAPKCRLKPQHQH